MKFVDYELEVSRLEQQLEKAESDLESVEVDKQNANLLIDLAKESLTLRTRELDRLKTLKQNGATSESEFDEAEKAFLEAKQLLTTEPAATILAIGMETGFKSQSAFYTAFKEITGLAPGNYRKQHIG